MYTLSVHSVIVRQLSGLFFRLIRHKIIYVYFEHTPITSAGTAQWVNTDDTSDQFRINFTLVAVKWETHTLVLTITTKRKKKQKKNKPHRQQIVPSQCPWGSTFNQKQVTYLFWSQEEWLKIELDYKLQKWCNYKRKDIQICPQSNISVIMWESNLVLRINRLLNWTWHFVTEEEWVCKRQIPRICN